MKDNGNKMLESVRHILQHIEISSFKAEFDLGSNQVKVELLAEFEGLDKKMNGLILNRNPGVAEDEEKENSKMNGEKENISEHEIIDMKDFGKETVAPEKKREMSDEDTKSPSEISNKINHFLASGLSVSEKKQIGKRPIEN